MYKKFKMYRMKFKKDDRNYLATSFPKLQPRMKDVFGDISLTLGRSTTTIVRSLRQCLSHL